MTCFMRNAVLGAMLTQACVPAEYIDCVVKAGAIEPLSRLIDSPYFDRANIYAAEALDGILAKEENIVYGSEPWMVKAREARGTGGTRLPWALAARTAGAVERVVRVLPQYAEGGFYNKAYWDESEPSVVFLLSRLTFRSGTLYTAQLWGVIIVLLLLLRAWCACLCFLASFALHDNKFD